jgi:hypothetical protein
VVSWLEDETEKAEIKPKSIELFLINDKKRLLSETGRFRPQGSARL